MVRSIASVLEERGRASVEIERAVD